MKQEPVPVFPIVGAMKDNGSPAVRFEFDEERTWFMVTVPVHEWFLDDTLSNDDTLNDTLNDTIKKEDADLQLTDRQEQMLALLGENDRMLIEELMAHFKVSRPTVNRDIEKLKKVGALIRLKGKKIGYWMVMWRVK